MSLKVSLKVSYGVLVAMLDRGTRWEVCSRVSAWVSLVVSDPGCGWNVLGESVAWGCRWQRWIAEPVGRCCQGGRRGCRWR